MATFNTQVSLLLARELLEACLFITSYFGAVGKSPHLSPEEKRAYNVYLTGGLGVALLAALTVSIIIGFALSKAVEQITNVADAVELGEGLSKMIAAWFVSGMLFKVPMWFDVSNYKEAGKSSKFARADAMGSKWEFCSMLFWNTFREFTEAGVITSTIVLLSPTGLSTLPASVAFGIGLSVVVGIIFYLGARYASVRWFGIFGTMLAGILTIGLISGAVHSLAEAYADWQNTENITGLVYQVNDDDLGSILASFEFIGLSDYHTRLSFSVWILAMALVPYSVYRHHYLGKPTFVETIKRKIKAIRGGKHDKEEEEEETPEGDGGKELLGAGSRVTKVQTGTDKPKNVNVEFSIPTNTYNPGSKGEITVKMQLEFPKSALPEGIPTVTINRVEEGSFATIPVAKVEQVDDNEEGTYARSTHESQVRADLHRSVARPAILSKPRDDHKV